MNIAALASRLDNSLPWVGRFFDWWKGELLEMVPSFLKQAMHPSDSLLLLLYRNESAGLLWHNNGHWNTLGESQAESRPEEIAGLLRSVEPGKHKIALRLPASAGLRRRVVLPLAAEQELQQVLMFQLDSLSPYPPNELYFSERIVERDFERGKLLVDLLMAPRQTVDQAVRQTEKWGLRPDMVDFVEDDELSLPQINLLPHPLSNQKPRSVLTRAIWILLLVNVLLLAGLATAHLQGKARLEEDLQTRVETARLKADTALKLREKVSKLKEQSSFLQNKKKQIVPAVTVLNELTELLPDGTWLERLVFKQAKVDLFGLSSKASTLISEIETSPIFEDVAFQAPVVQEERFSSERFQISTRVTLPNDYAN